MQARTQLAVDESPPALEALLHSIGDGQGLTPAIAAEILAEAALDAGDLFLWTEFDHPIQDSYGRRLVARGARFELMVMSWLPGDYSSVHDHGFTEWGAVRYFGPADHVVFAERAGRLGIETRSAVTPNSVAAVDHDLIHLMGNPGNSPFLSMHLYGLGRPCDRVTGDSRIFDLFEQRIQRTDAGVFYCLPEREISRREPCPPAELETMLLHHRLMLSRVERIIASGEGDGATQLRARKLQAEIDRLVAGEEPRRP